MKSTLCEIEKGAPDGCLITHSWEMIKDRYNAYF